MAALQIAYACLNCPSRNVWYIIVDVTILRLCGLVKVLYVVVGEYVICSTISILVILGNLDGYIDTEEYKTVATAAP